MDDEVVIYGDPLADGAPLTYQLYDDDTTVLPQYLALGPFASAYSKAYICVDYLSSNYRSTVTFIRNLSSFFAYYHNGDWDDSYGVPSTDSFWTVLVCAAFQCETGSDCDPSTEAGTGGVTAMSSNECLVYAEVGRENNSLEEDTAHEIGHAGRGIGHCSTGTCLMDGTASQDFFCDDCIAELRSHSNY